MKQFYIPIILLVLTSCSNNLSHKRTNIIKTTKPEVRVLNKNDVNLYIDNVGYFSNTNEFYVDLPLKSYSEQDFKELSSKVDSVIFEDDENLRRRLPMELAKQYFDLGLLDSLNIYDYSNRQVSSAKLLRVEYWDDVIESSFIAVYKPDSFIAKAEANFYCLSPYSTPFYPFKTEKVIDNKLTAYIKKELSLDIGYEWALEHRKVLPSNTIYTIISFSEPKSYKAISYLTEFSNNKLKVLMKLNEEYVFWDFLPLPIEINNMPVLLMKFAVPDTDSGESSIPLVYDKKEYKFSVGNRVLVGK